MNESNNLETNTDSTGDTVIAIPLSHLLAQLTRPVLALIKPTALSFPPVGGPLSHPPTTAVLGNIHLRALECLNNLFVALNFTSDASESTVQLSRNDAHDMAFLWDSLWQTLRSVGYLEDPGQEMRREIWQVAAGVLWGIARACRGTLVCGLLSKPKC